MQLDNLIFVLTTAIAVSLDSFFAGFAIGVKNGKSLLLPLMTAIMTAVACMLTSLLAKYLSTLIQSEWLDNIGGAILLMVGLYNLISAKTQPTSSNHNKLLQAIIVGFAVALDASIACLSLTVMEFSPYLVTALFTLTHFFTVAIGQLFASMPKAVKVLENVDWLGGAILIVLAFIKIM